MEPVGVASEKIVSLKIDIKNSNQKMDKKI